MTELQKHINSFRNKYKRFNANLTSEDVLEKWNEDENGAIDVFYENELVSIALTVISSDGKIFVKEAGYLDETFGFSYTADDLAQMYINAHDEIDNYFEDCFKQGYQMLRDINEDLAKQYKDIFYLLCKIVAESDGVVSDDEKKLIASMKLD